MSRPQLTLTSLLSMVEEVSDSELGQGIKRLLRWQVSKGQVVAYRLTWYLRHIVRDSRMVRHYARKVEERKGMAGGDKSFGEILRRAMEVEG